MIYYVTHEDWPTSEQVLAAAQAAGASEVRHTLELPEGVHEEVEPAPTVPEAVTRAQAKIALARAGYYEQADALINAIPGAAGVEARIWWNEAETFRFEHPLVDQMCAAMTPPISAEAKVNLFRAAALID